MKRYKTRFDNKIGDIRYPIYLVEKDVGYGDVTLDLECEREIPSVAWYTVYKESVKDLESGDLIEGI